MKKLALTVLVLVLAACGQQASPPKTQPGVSAQASVVTCTWLTPEYPHISSFNYKRGGTIDIKSSMQGECNPSSDPLTVTAQMYLEKQGFLGVLWSTVAAGAPIAKSIQGTGQIWRRGELFAVAPCVPGTYRGRLVRSVRNAGGIAVLLGDDIVSPARYIDCKPKSVSMVIDDTGSMSGVIGAVSSALASYISGTPEDEYTLWNLTTFKDSPTNVGNTDDRSQVLSWVNGLFASGGGDCPEDVLGGISTGISALSAAPDNDKEMIVATDASAQSGDVDGIIASARATGVKVNVLLTGDCGLSGVAGASISRVRSQGVSAMALSSQVVLKRIAEATGGKFFYIPGGTQADFTAALAKIFESIENPEPVDAEPPVIAVSVNPTTLWPPNHKMVEVTPRVSATDNLDPNPAVEFVGVKVTEPDDGQGDGNTTGDVQVTADGRVFLRAERSGGGNGRVYTLTYRATDAAGNVGFGSADVTVPKNRSGK